MSVDSMAPEAFTNSELSKAMTWREKQPEYIQKMTSTPESLMSFYKRFLRSKKSPHAARDGESFRQDLKSLAEGLKNFEGGGDGEVSEPVSENSQPTPPTPQPTSHRIPFNPTLGPTIDFEDPAASASSPLSQSVESMVKQPQIPLENVVIPQSVAIPATSPLVSQTSAANLDNDSQKMLKEIQIRMNLSSEEEALRALIKVGYERLVRSF